MRQSDVPLLERVIEVDRFRSSLAEAAEGAPGVLLVEGPVGTGKSLLLHHYADVAQQAGADVLHASASRGEQHVPLGVVRQLVTSPNGGGRAELRGELDRVARRTGAGEAGEAAAGADSGALGPPGPSPITELVDRLLDRAGRTTLVVTVDDVHHADAASVECLLGLVTRARRATVLVVLSVSTAPGGESVPSLAELLNRPHVGRVHLRPLGLRSVADHLRVRLGDDAPAAVVHGAGGANPSLLRGIVEDHLTARAWGVDAPRGPGFGTSFRQAVLLYLHRAGPITLAVARAFAVLGDDGTPASVATLTGHGRDVVDTVLDELGRAGVAWQTLLGEPTVRRAVCDDIPTEIHGHLRRAAVELLEALDVPATTLSRHLVAGAAPCDEHGLHLLREGAEKALRRDDLEHATACVDLAHRSVRDASGRAQVAAFEAAVRWRANPATARPLLRSLVPAVRAGQLPLEPAIDLLPRLLAAGMADEADSVLEDLVRRVDSEGDEHLRATFAVTVRSLRATHPELPVAGVPHDRRGRAVISRPRLALEESARGLSQVLRTGPDPAVTRAATHLLRTSALTDDSVESMMLALSTLTYSDELAAATAAGEALLGETARRDATPWRATVSALLGEAALRAGNPWTARWHAAEALSALSARGWGVAIGLPLGVLIQALVTVGDMPAAAVHVDVPVPAAMSGTRFVVPYLQARARFHLAGGETALAETDLRICGETVTRWDVDTPTFAPWRLGLALLRLRDGETDAARDLLREHAARPGSDSARVAGVELRLRAACSGPASRQGLLQRSVELLRECGDRVELRRSLLSLGRAHRAAGQPDVARALVARAGELAEEIGIAGERAAGADPRSSPPPPAPVPDADAEPLTTAERRVADLAARGDTNRMIAATLFVTVSTVEQHLTRIYKKLGVGRRQDLAVDRADRSRARPDGPASPHRLPPESRTIAS